MSFSPQKKIKNNSYHTEAKKIGNSCCSLKRVSRSGAKTELYTVVRDIVY